MNKDVECPYCSYETDICHDDGYGYKEGEIHQQWCRNCEKYFAYKTSIVFYYEAFKADCLNDGEHVFKTTMTYPIEFTKMECVQCGERRDLNDDEMKKLIGTKP